MYYLFTVGFSLSGKTWLVNKIKEKFPKQFVSVESRAIHDFLNTMDAFKDDNTVNGPAYDLRQEATYEIRKVLIKFFAEKGINMIQDSGNQVKKDRVERLDIVKSIIPDVKSILVYVNTDIKVIEQRALEEDEKLIKEGRPVAWQDLIVKQKERIEVPTKDEASYFIEYDGNNTDIVLEELEKIMHP